MSIAQLFLNIASYQGLPVEFGESLEALYSLDFEDSGLAIRDILNNRYPDGITGLVSVETTDSTITGIFLDQISPTVTKKFNFSIDAATGDVSYDQIDTGDLDFSEVDFAVKKSQTCTEGKSAGCTREDGSIYCIALGKKCKSVKLNPEETVVVKEVIVKAAKAGKVTKPPKPKVVKEPKLAKEKVIKEKVVKEKTRKTTKPVEDISGPKKPKEDIKQSKKSVAEAKEQIVELDRRRKALVDILGEETVAKAEENLKNIFDNTSQVIRVPSTDILEKIFNSGRFKNLHDTGTNGGSGHKDIRDKSEDSMFAGNKDTPVKDKPIYGVFSNENEPDFTSNSSYGNIVVKLKPQVRNKSTLTGSDSLGVGLDGKSNYQPSQVDKPNLASFISNNFIDKPDADRLKYFTKRITEAKDIQDIREAGLSKDPKLSGIGAGGGYIEFQTHNSVSLDDIEKITFIKMDQDYEDTYEASDLIKKRAKELGITLEDRPESQLVTRTDTSINSDFDSVLAELFSKKKAKKSKKVKE